MKWKNQKLNNFVFFFQYIIKKTAPTSKNPTSEAIIFIEAGVKKQ